MIKRLLSMLLSLTVILSLVPPITAAAADEDTGIMTQEPPRLRFRRTEAFLWESSSDRKTLFGVNPEWYKEHVTDAGIQSISIKIPASTETIRKDFGGSYATIEGYSTAGTELIPAKLDCQQVLVDFSAATNLKTIGLQAFFQVSGLTGVIDLSKTKVEVIEGTAFKKTAITGVILPTTLKRVGNDNANSSGDASVFGQCKNLAYIRVADGDPNAVLELPSSLQLIGYTGFLLDGTKIEDTMKTNPLSSKFRSRSRKCSIRQLDLITLRPCGTHSISLRKQILLIRSSRTTAYSTALTRTTGVSQGLPTRKPTIALSRSILTAPSFTAIPPMSLT